MRTSRAGYTAAAVALVAGLAACGGGGNTNNSNVAPGPVSAPPRTIVFADFAFLPTTITAMPGDTWTEENDDVATHNISTEAYLRANPNSSGGDIAPDVDAGQKKTFKMPTKPGTYKVVCFYHRKMTATITIKK
ncbi:MAG TPA: plastocyanin/azurin family copper-binding protein [Sporichthyaceae bacterium]|jgi:plastocyanin